MGWIEDIKNYIPHNEEEAQDKNVALLSISKFNNLLTRENPLIHVTSSGYIVNKNRTKVLMVHHNIYKTWCWTGNRSRRYKGYYSRAIISRYNRGYWTF